MKNLIRPASIALYLLSLSSFFLIGIYIAKLSGAGENQGLAAAAIVIGYGFIAACFALIASLVAAYRLHTKTIVKLNWILLAVTAIFVALTAYNVNQRQKEKQKELKQSSPVQPTKPADQNFLMGSFGKVNTPKSEITGMGYYKAHSDYPTVLHLFNDGSPMASIRDSIVFDKGQHGNTDISYAPPQLYPEHLKLDYNILLFKIISITQAYCQIEINKQTGESAWVLRESGNLLLWPDFLLTVHSVEALDPSINPVRSKALDHASIVTAEYDFLQVIQVKGDWIEVKLFDDAYNLKGTGWLKWQDSDGLLIGYSLLS